MKSQVKFMLIKTKTFYAYLNFVLIKFNLHKKVETMSKLAFGNYLKVRNELDSVCDRLHKTHQANTQCRKGCDSCCMNFSVLPVEFFSILESTKNNPPKLNLEDEEKCLFLVDHSCQIYEHRPSICRSHGLPILNMDEEGENMELSYCPLNFNEVDEEYFTLDNGFQQDVFNSKLYLANRGFVQKKTEAHYKENELIELRRMKEFL